MVSAGADVLEVDHQIEMAAACRTVPAGIALWGNLDPVSVLVRGRVQEVRQATRNVLQTVAASGHRRFVLSSGCTLAVDTPPENLVAMLEAAREFGPLFRNLWSLAEKQHDCSIVGGSRRRRRLGVDTARRGLRA